MYCNKMTEARVTQYSLKSIAKCLKFIMANLTRKFKDGPIDLVLKLGGVVDFGFRITISRNESR